MIKERIIKSYIGITGFNKSTEVEEMLRLVPKNSKRLLMVGVLASSDTLKGIDIGKNRYPKIEDIKNIFVDDPLALNLIHYNTKDINTLNDQLIDLAKIGGENLHGFQLNNTWPPIEELSKYQESYPEHIIVLVITSNAFDKMNYYPNLLVKKIKEYGGLVDYILLDQSEGAGMLLNPEFFRIYIEKICRLNLDVKIGIAGGLAPDNLYIIKSLVKQFPNICIDSENNIRDQNDFLDLNVARDYLDKSFKLFND